MALLGARQVGKSTLARQLVATRRGPTAWFDSGESGRSGPFGRSRPRVAAAPRARRPGRDPTVARRLPVAAHAGGPAADAGPVSRSRQRVARSAPSDLGVARRPGCVSRAGRFRPARGRRHRTTLAARGLSPFVPRPLGGGQPPLARRLHSYFSRGGDLPGLGGAVPSATLRRFWTMLAHWHGQLWNGAEFGRAFGVAHTTVRRYLDLLSSVFVVQQLAPWHENVGKRQVRSPKVYVGDSGHPPCAAGPEHPRGRGLASQGGRFVGGVRRPAGNTPARRAPGAVLPLVDVLRRGARLARRGR